MLLDPRAWSLAQSSDEVLARLSDELSADAHSRVKDVASLVALIQSLAYLEIEGDHSWMLPSPEVLAENRFLAARDGMDARLIDSQARCLIPVREILDSLLADCRDPRSKLGCADALDRVQRLAATNGAERQRALVARSGRLDHLVVSLAERFLLPPVRASAEARRRAHI